eukprot:SAG22_NODE_555_length_9124_cov_114.706593_3_plen_157_part_00
MPVRYNGPWAQIRLVQITPVLKCNMYIASQEKWSTSDFTIRKSNTEHAAWSLFGNHDLASQDAHYPDNSGRLVNRSCESLRISNLSSYMNSILLCIYEFRVVLAAFRMVSVATMYILQSRTCGDLDHAYLSQARPKGRVHKNNIIMYIYVQTRVSP